MDKMAPVSDSFITVSGCARQSRNSKRDGFRSEHYQEHATDIAAVIAGNC